MIAKFFPWKFLLKRISRSYGFIDPVSLLAKFNSFAQPADMVAPSELLRAGASMHARGLLNSQAIQHNLDWIWPYWVCRQFNPKSKSFIPRAFAITHINLTHRNWTAAGFPGTKELPIVDPRGLLTPILSGWSVDCWIIGGKGNNLIPPHMESAKQSMDKQNPGSIITEFRKNTHRLKTRAGAAKASDGTTCSTLEISASTDSQNAKLVISLRPYNPEGVSFLESIKPFHDNGHGWKINKNSRLFFNKKPSDTRYSTYEEGDVYHKLNHKPVHTDGVKCKTGMATSAALYKLTPGNQLNLSISVPLGNHIKKTKPAYTSDKKDFNSLWKQRMKNACVINVPDKKYNFLYKNALHTMILHSPDDIFAGPFIYKRFWFRDAALISHAMLVCGLHDSAVRAAERFPSRQNGAGYFISQEGEWDSNGQVLWIYDMIRRFSGRNLNKKLVKSTVRGADWICRKITKDKGDTLHSGLLPPGFSAEHFGPNDYYYWDDFWAAAGLESASRIMESQGDDKLSQKYREFSEKIYRAVEKSLEKTAVRRKNKIMPVSPYRRPDSACVGSLALSYPLQLCGKKDERAVSTANFLFDKCTIKNALFHDISHSGLNPYLTLHMAQTFLRAGDKRYINCMNAVADFASSTGQWPEAIHPNTGTGCMGDGQHVWAAAEWACIVRNLFVREEYNKNTLILCSGLLPGWLKPGQKCSAGPVPTSFGSISVNVSSNGKTAVIKWQGEWIDKKPGIIVDPVWGKLISQDENTARVSINRTSGGKN